jgi:hypothetical protein
VESYVPAAGIIVPENIVPFNTSVPLRIRNNPGPCKKKVVKLYIAIFPEKVEHDIAEVVWMKTLRCQNLVDRFPVIAQQQFPPMPAPGKGFFRGGQSPFFSTRLHTLGRALGDVLNI